MIVVYTMVACGRAVAKSLSARSTSLIKCRLTRLGLLPTTTSHQQLRWPCSGRVCTARYATVNAPRDRVSIINRVTTARCFSSLFTNHMTTPIHNCEPTSLTLQYPHLWHLIHSPAERQKRSSAGMTRRTRPRLAEELPTPVAHVAEP